jgi:hypothetical protein
MVVAARSRAMDTKMTQPWRIEPTALPNVKGNAKGIMKTSQYSTRLTAGFGFS